MPVEKKQEPTVIRNYEPTASEEEDEQEEDPVITRHFPPLTDLNYDHFLTSVYGNQERERPSFNFEFSFGLKSEFQGYDNQEVAVTPGNSQIRLIKTWYRPADGILRGI